MFIPYAINALWFISHIKSHYMKQFLLETVCRGKYLSIQPLSSDCCYFVAWHDPHYLMNYSWADRFISARHYLPSQITCSRGNASPRRQRGRELSPRWCCHTHTHTAKTTHRSEREGETERESEEEAGQAVFASSRCGLYLVFTMAPSRHR